MNYIGVYHSDHPRSTIGICDAPCISKGRMLLCARDAASEGRTLAMANGRIRNRNALAAILNCPPDAKSSQLVLLAYRKWGSEYPKYIEGPVMTCVMDTEFDRMILSRDRMGEQPVFYTENNGSIVFADHPDSLLKSAAVKPIVDENGMQTLFGLGPARNPGRTPLKSINSLMPGCILCCNSGKSECIRYFAIKNAVHVEDVDDTITHVRALLEEAVDSIAYLHPGAMLSGGLDSTALTALLCRRCGSVQTFSVDYRDNDSDFRANTFRPEMDAPYVELAAEYYSTEHRNCMLEQAALADALAAAVSARGFPGMADVDSSLLLFAGEITPYSPVVVSGECGDEVFGGYPWFRGEAPLKPDGFPWSGSVELRESVLKPELRKKLNLKRYIRSVMQEAIERTGIDGSNEDREIRLKRMQLICFDYFMANLQERAVRMCSHRGLEVLTPLCDDRLVQYVFNVPWDLKFLGGMEKGLFRATVADIVPDSLRNRKKSPYPKTCSPIYTEIIRGLTMAMLADRDAPILEWIDEERVRSIAESALDPADTPWFGQLMAGPQMLAYLLQVNTWMRERNIMVSL